MTEQDKKWLVDNKFQEGWSITENPFEAGLHEGYSEGSKAQLRELRPWLFGIRDFLYDYLFRCREAGSTKPPAYVENLAKCIAEFESLLKEASDVAT